MCEPCSTTPVSQDTEGGRIARIQEASRAQMREQALAKARALRGGPGTCGGVRCASAAERIQPNVPVPSAVLINTVKACYSGVSREGCVPSSVRTARIQLDILEKERDPFNPITRFSDLTINRPVIATVCPPIPLEALNANIPKQNMRNCPLPNKPDNPVLPT
jgi:hypothetical protein